MIQIRRTSSVTAQFTNPQEVIISHTDDSIKIGDGTDFLAVNADGSINANLDGQVTTIPASVVNYFEEALSVPTSSLTTVLSYTAVDPKFVFAITFSGTNVATFTLKVNSTVWDRMRTSYTKFNDEYSLGGGVIDLQPGDTIEVEVIHSQSAPGDFEAKIQIRDQA